MMLTLIEPPAEYAVDLDEAKAHARIEVDDDDKLIQGLIATATQYAETYTQRALIEQQWEVLLDSWPCRERWLNIPHPPLRSIDEVTYLDRHGDEQVWEEENFRILKPSGPTCEPGRIVLRQGTSWPHAINEPGSIKVKFTAGYGLHGAQVPAELRLAIKTHVAEMYENRESTVLTGAVLQEVPFSVNNLLWPFVVGKFGLE